MKKRLLFFMVLVVALVVLLAISVSADVIYKDASGNVMFTGVDSNSDRIFESYTGSFPNTDEQGNALTWYIVSSEAVDADTVHTVASFLTIDATGEHASLSAKGEYKYVNQAKELSIVSAYFPNNSNVLTISMSDNGYGSTYDYKTDKSNILFLTLPNTLTVLPQRIAQATPLIDCTIPDDAPIPSFSAVCFYRAKNLRSVDIPAAVTILYSNDHSNNGCTFFECVSLVDVDFAEDSRLETIQVHAFYNCSALKEITIPNSVIDLQYRAFEACSSLETIRLGANVAKGFESYNVQSLLYLCKSLKYVYMSNTMVPTSGSHMFSDGASGMVFFYTGTQQEYEALKSTLATLGNNGKFTGATAIEWDATQSDQYYKDLAANNNKNYVVYGYSKCNAFYGGHVSEGYSVSENVNFLDTVNIYGDCTRCNTGAVVAKVNALYTWLGYSCSEFADANGRFSVTQGFGVNRDAIAEYEKYLALDFGIVVTGNVSGEAFSPSLDGEKVVSVQLNNLAHDYFEIKVTGIDESHKATKIVFCAYVKAEDTIYYLDNGTTGTTVAGKAYSQI